MLTGEGLLSSKDGSKATLRIQDPADSRRQLTQLEFLMLPPKLLHCTPLAQLVFMSHTTSIRALHIQLFSEYPASCKSHDLS